MIEMSYRAVSDSETKTPTVEADIISHRQSGEYGPQSRWASFLRIAQYSGLIVTTICSTVLLVGHLRQWHYTGAFSKRIFSQPATTVLVVQIIANLLAIIQLSAVCELLNVLVRHRLVSRSGKIQDLQFWIALVQRRMDWNVSLKLLTPLAILIAITIAPAAIWAGALAPLRVQVAVAGTLNVPAYDNMNLLHEYDPSHRATGPEIRTAFGIFSYNVGLKFQGLLLQVAAPATTPDGSIRLHSKLDDSQYIYQGRSYGMAASAGLLSNGTIPQATTSYTYEDYGYLPKATCIYNASSMFVLSGGSGDDDQVNTYAATGALPNSTPGRGEWYTFTGNSDDNIVAIGAAAEPVNSQRIIAFAAGKNYDFLNTAQCTVEFAPQAFNMSVSVANRTISVQPSTVGPVNDIDLSGVLTHTVMRQFPLISGNLWGWYLSLTGESFNSSITDYKASMSELSEAEAALGGITNSIEAMVDDMLVGYASAQMFIARDTAIKPAQFNVPGVSFGQRKYIYISFAINLVVVALVCFQGIYTKGWRGLPAFNCLDPKSMMLAASRGGRNLAQAEDEKKSGSGNLIKVKLRGVEGDALVAE